MTMNSLDFLVGGLPSSSEESESSGTRPSPFSSSLPKSKNLKQGSRQGRRFSLIAFNRRSMKARDLIDTSGERSNSKDGVPFG